MKPMEKLTSAMLLMLLLLTACNSGPISNTDTSDLTVNSAVVQSWDTGVDGAVGKTYTIEFTMEKEAVLEFDSLWMMGLSLKVDPTLKGGGEMNWKRGDVMQLMAIEYLRKGKLTSGTLNAINPEGYEGEALVRYFKNGEPNYFVVKDFKMIK